MSVSDRLLDCVLRDGTRSAVVIGTAKNVGKTVTFNAVRRAAARRGFATGVTSIGRDGEPSDALDGLPKPRVRLEAGTIVALPRDLVPRSPGMEILDIGEGSALGPIVFARVRSPMWCEIGGPPTARGVRATIDRLLALANGPVFIDGAIDRIAPLAGGDDAIVLATGVASGATVRDVAERAAVTVRRLTTPGRDPGREREVIVTIDGVLDARAADDLLAAARGATVVVSDPTRIVVGGTLFMRLAAAVDLRCEHPLRVVACTTSSFGRGRALDPRTLVRAVADATRLPCFDVVAELAA
jgi:hypothetical protein